MTSLFAAHLSIFTVTAFGQPLVMPAIVEKVSRSVVLIKGTAEQGSVLGSGFIVSADGKIVTNLHVIRGMKTGAVQLASGDVFDSFSIIAHDERRDIAILQIAGFDLPQIELGNSNEVKVGEQVIAIGSPHGLDGTVTSGIISAVRNSPDGTFKIIQTDAAANPGNSGGPLLNSRGQAIGVVAGKRTNSESLNFAIPINYARGLLDAASAKALSLRELQTSLLDNRPAQPQELARGLPTIWKSLISGSRFKVRIDGDWVYVERLFLEDQSRAGAFNTWELRQREDGMYIGIARVVRPCEYTYSDWPNGMKSVVNRCPYESQAEVTKLSESRIEGRLKQYLPDTKLNCRKCSFSKPPVWIPFSWIPE